MSVELFRACAQVTMLYRDAPMSSGQKFVLRELCDFAGPDGVAWPKQEALMVRTCLKRPAIIANTDALEGAGWLKRRRSTQLEYVLNTEAIMSNTPPMDAPQRSEIERLNVRKSNIECSEIERLNVRKSNIECSEIERFPIKRTDNEQTEEQTLNRASAKQPMIPLPQRLCLQLSAALKINGQPTTAVSSTHPGMLALVKAIPAEWEDTALAMVPEVVRELVGNGKAGPGLYAYALAVLKTRMERAVSQSGQVAGATPTPAQAATRYETPFSARMRGLGEMIQRGKEAAMAIEEDASEILAYQAQIEANRRAIK